MAGSDSSSKSVPLIQFLSFEGCPLAEAAQAVLERALQACGLSTGHYEVVDMFDPATPDSLTAWGSPTILVNGEDVTGQGRSDGVGCRIYDTPDQVPTAESIIAAIRNSAGA